MDIDESCDNKHNGKSCIDLKYNILGSLNITSNISNSTLTFWNKFQLFVYDTNNINHVKYFVPEFQIKEVLVDNNFIIFLDICGNVHISKLKFKNSAQKIFKVGFQPKAQNVVAIRLHTENTILCLKYESKSYYVCVNKLSMEFQLESKATLHSEDYMPSLNGNIILISQMISIDNDHSLRNVFDIKDKWREGLLIILSFDKQSIYCSFTNPAIKETNIKLVKLYMCPSPLGDIKLLESETVSLLIGLVMGSMIKLDLGSKHIATEHLNCALLKFEVIDNCLFYTDGDTMWICKEIFSTCQNFRQIFVENVYCFTRYESQMAVTTFDNLVYLFPLDEIIFINEENKDIYCPANKVLSNSGYLVNILEELDKNKEVVQKMSVEKNYLICLSLSKRPDIMNNMIQSRVDLFHKYENAIMKNNDYILPEALKKYFVENTVIFSIQFDCTNLNQYFSEMLSYLKHMKIHISFHTKNITLKLVAIKIHKLHNFTHILLPQNIENINDKLSINIKLVTKIPTAFDKKNHLWPVLYNNDIEIKSPQFLKMVALDKIKYLKDSESKIEKLICESSVNLHGNLFKIKNKSNNEELYKWTVYVKLPDTFESILKNDELFADRLNCRQVTFLAEQMKNESFMKCKSSVTLHINSCKAIISLAKEEFSNYCKLKISCEDIAVAYNLQNFFSDVFYKYFTSASVCSELYTTTENIQKALQESVNAGSQSTILPLLEEFNREVIGALLL